MANVTINGVPADNSPVGVSDLGTGIMDNVVFPAGSYVDDDGVQQDYNEVRLDAVLLSKTKEKIIEISQISGRPGTVKEFVSDGDYVITLSGTISPSSPNESTQQLEADLETLSRVPEALDINSKFLIVSGVTMVVITSIDISDTSGDSKTIRMSMLSDREIDLSGRG